MALLSIDMLLYSFFPLFFVSLSKANEAATMISLRASLSLLPSSSWNASDSYCTWSGVECDTFSHVTSINLASKSISGVLPSNLTSLAHLTTLSLQSNSFNGPIPLLSNLTYLREIRLDSNGFSSVPTGTFDNLPSLQTLTLSHNPSLSPWELPTFSGIPNLTVFEAVNTSITGSLPSLLWALNLRVLRLSHNQLSGTIWVESGYPFKLETLWLDHQEPGFSGPIDFLATMTQLAQAWLNDNAFDGPIPDLSNCPNIFDLQLADNQLLGVVPKTLSSLPNLLNISLQNNNLYGPYPNFSTRVKVEIGNATEFCSDKPGEPCDEQMITLLDVIESMGYPTNLMEAWRGKDACTWRFIGCDGDGKITTLNFTGQWFEGEIPSALGNLTSLQYLYLNGNAFDGSIPESFTALPQLKLLDVSHNYLTGMMPNFRSSVRVSAAGSLLVANESVFEAVITSIQGFQTPTSSGSSGTTTLSGSVLGLDVKAFVPVCVALVTLVVLGICFMLCLLSKRYNTRRHVNEWEQDEEGQVLGGLVRRFSYKSVKLATKNFDPKRKLGGGGFGSVYDGALGDGTKVAVKRLDRLGQGRKEFVAEVKTLGTIHHVNLVKLVGFCDENNCKVLVYEYLSNGSLDKWIFPKMGREGFTRLDWKTRKRVVLGIAKGIAYLHDECQHRIAHLDIKPENILLDENLNVKLADFGLAKLIGRDESFVMTQMRGTRGYLAPEWLTRRITEKADVYSFGIVLLEVVYERRNLDYSTYHEQDEEESCYRLLIDLVKEKAETDRLLDLADGCYQDMDGIREEVEKMVKIAICCLHEDPTRRPTMSMVVKALEGQTDMLATELESTYVNSLDSSLVGSSGQGSSSSLLASTLSGPR